VVQAGLVGLSLRHREAQKGILLFFERFVQLSTFWPDETRGSAGAIGTTSGQAPSTNPLNLAAKVLVQQHGAALLAKIFALLSGEMTAYALDESNGCISDVLWYMKKRYKDEFQVGSKRAVCMTWCPVTFVSILAEVSSLNLLPKRKLHSVLYRSVWFIATVTMMGVVMLYRYGSGKRCRA
jgi:hypothetical protein